MERLGTPAAAKVQRSIFDFCTPPKSEAEKADDEAKAREAAAKIAELKEQKQRQRIAKPSEGPPKRQGDFADRHKWRCPLCDRHKTLINFACEVAKGARN